MIGMNRTKRRWVVAAGFVAVVSAALLVRGVGTDERAGTDERPVESGAPGPLLPVLAVVDGDTIRVEQSGESVPVRLIGVDAPEVSRPAQPAQCFGAEASSFMTDLVEGERVRLEHDRSQGRLDDYGRQLAYVWLAEGRLANELVIGEGFAFEYTYDEAYEYRDRFRAAQADAERNARGLWAPQTCAGETGRHATPQTLRITSTIPETDILVQLAILWRNNRGVLSGRTGQLPAGATAGVRPTEVPPGRRDSRTCRARRRPAGSTTSR